VLAKSAANRQARIYLGNHLRQLGLCQERLGFGADLAETARELAALDLHRDSAFSAAQFFLHAHRLLGDAAPHDLLPQAMAQLLAAERHGFDSAGALDDGLFAPLHERAEWTALRARLDN
jgi:hypothetical protein